MGSVKHWRWNFFLEAWTLMDKEALDSCNQEDYVLNGESYTEEFTDHPPSYTPKETEEIHNRIVGSFVVLRWLVHCIQQDFDPMDVESAIQESKELIESLKGMYGKSSSLRGIAGAHVLESKHLNNAIHWLDDAILYTGARDYRMVQISLVRFSISMKELQCEL